MLNLTCFELLFFNIFYLLLHNDNLKNKSKFAIYFTSEMFDRSEWFSGEKWPNLRLTMMVSLSVFSGMHICARPYFV